MTLELANRSVTYSNGITEDVIVKVDKFNFLADFVIVDFEADPRVPIILGRPVLRTAKALIDLYEEKLTLWIGNEELVFRAKKFSKNSPSRERHSVHSINIINSPCEEISNQNKQSSGVPLLILIFLFLEFADELAHIISPPEYDHFYFDIEIDPGELSRLLNENISSRIKEDKELKSKTSTKKLTIHELNDLRLLLSNCDSTFSEEFSEIVPLLILIFLFLVMNHFTLISIINGVHSKRSPILPLNDFSPLLFISDLLFFSDPSEIESFLSFTFGNKDKVFDSGILCIDGVLSFTRKSPHLLNDNFKIVKCHILSKISSKIESFVSFHPMDKEMRGESS
ncbi:reverse transcriptase domain-containing protein [Tanacetum coccineum]